MKGRLFKMRMKTIFLGDLANKIAGISRGDIPAQGAKQRMSLLKEELADLD